MLSAEQWRQQCLDLAYTPGISSRRNAMLLAITRDWLALTTKMDEYEALVEEEDGPAAKRGV